MKVRAFICAIYNQESENELSRFILNLEKNGYSVLNTWDNNVWEAPKEYIQETGDTLENRILIINSLSLSEISKLKLFLMEQEVEFTKNNRRTLNLNPGYLSPKGMFLITHKDNPYRKREEIANNLWQEKQYAYNGSTFEILDNTFSEYRDNERIAKFTKLFDE